MRSLLIGLLNSLPDGKPSPEVEIKHSGSDAFNLQIKIKAQLFGVMAEVKQHDQLSETPPSLLLLATTFTNGNN